MSWQPSSETYHQLHDGAHSWLSSHHVSPPRHEAMTDAPQKLPALTALDLPFSPDALRDMSPGVLTALCALPLALFLVKRVLYPTVTAREPPVLRPAIPFVGHVVSLIREKTGMFDRL